MNAQVSIDELLSALAHELNQPLGAILRNAEAATILLRSVSPDLQELREIIDDIRADDQRAADIVRSALTQIRKNDVAMVAVDLSAMARETGRLVEPEAASKGVRVLLETESSPTVVTGDPIRLRQLVNDLLLNGVGAAAGSSAERREVVVKTARNSDTVELSVTDSGAGFPPDALPRLFEPSFTADARGTWIALSQTRGIVEAHLGRIAAANNAGGGATIRVTLPLRTAEAAKRA
jgi:two-component system, LuxR family, sensor kinase FixL